MLDFRISSTKRLWPFLTTTTQKSLNQVLAFLNLYQHAKKISLFSLLIFEIQSILESRNQIAHTHFWACPTKIFSITECLHSFKCPNISFSCGKAFGGTIRWLYTSSSSWWWKAKESYVTIHCGNKIYHNLKTLPNFSDDKTAYKHCIDKLHSIYKPENNVTAELYRFCKME